MSRFFCHKKCKKYLKRQANRNTARGNEQGRTMYLLTEWEGRTGKYLARGYAVRTERSEVRANDQEPNIFPSGPN